MKWPDKHTLLRAGKTGVQLLTTAALAAAPAGIAGVILKSVTRPALRGAAILVLEPVIRAGMKKVIGRFTPENYETSAK
ncbi:hypothetical protein ACXHVK_002746 [Morganella morganii]|uniref:hypothetical protein n=1 Tax=Morganella sp. Je.2.23 TaxID=3142840 RepID=UPI00229F28C8|nr:hypothetical protein [Morganella morganii]EGT3632140.1 hypothetical protein [Morganella morganii]EGT3635375.1 hypothetical protein [Morganella morganii]EJD6039501.1 hypothetical protein [Morganella morganii]EKK5378185.1 hypothetical protein [Morganella morganii]